MKNYILSTLVAVALIGSVSAECLLDNGLVAFYSFNGNANDSIGSNNISANGYSYSINQLGCPNSALLLTNNDHLYSSISVLISGASDRTISFWCNLKDTNSYARIGWGVDKLAGQCVVQATVQGIWFTTFYNDLTANIPNPLNTNQWAMYTLTYSGQSNIAKAYVNGVLVSPTSFYPEGTNLSYQLNTTASPIHIETYYGCSISDLAIYNRDLSSNEVSQLYYVQSQDEESYLAQSLPTNRTFFNSLASNPDFISALATSITSSPSSYGVLQQGVQGIQGPVGPRGLQGIQGVQGPTGVFDPTVLTNRDFLTGLASNSIFLDALTAQIQNGTNNYGIAVKQNQSLNFPAIPALTITPIRKYTNVVTASSGLSPVIQISGNTAVATVSNNVLTPIGSGSTTITVSQAGNALWNPISATQPLVVNKGVQTLAFPAIPAQTYSTFKTLTLKATSSAKLTPITYSSDNTAVAIVSNNILLLQGKGTSAITATQAGNVYFTPATATQTLIVK